MTIEQLREGYQRALFGWYPIDPDSKTLVITGDACFNDLAFFDDNTVLHMTSADVIEPNFLRRNKGAFEYIFLVYVVETVSDPIRFLKQMRQILSSKGVLIVACENRLGVKYFCGERDPFSDESFAGINNYKDTGEKRGRSYSKSELSLLFADSGFQQQKYYSVFPGLAYPELILAEDYCSNENLASRYTPLYHSPETVLVREEELSKAFIENGTIHFFADAFLVECPLGKEPLPINQVTISANRGIGHATITTIYNNHVVKRPLFKNGISIKEIDKNHERLKKRGLPIVDGYIEGSSYIMPLILGTTGDVFLRRLLIRDQDRFIKEMDRFFELILSSSDIIGETEIGKIFSVGYPDLVPLNTIYSQEQYIIIDQEYRMDNCPVDFVVYRFVNIVYANDEKLDLILPKEFFYKRYHLYGKINALMKMDADFNNTIKNRNSLRSFRDEHLRYDQIMIQNRENLNKNIIYQRYVDECFLGVEDKKIYVCGSDEIAAQFVEKYNNDLNICKVIDDDRSMWGETIGGYPVSPINAMVGDQEAYKVIICSENYKTLLKQMLRMQVWHIGIYDPEREYKVQRVIHKEGKDRRYHLGYCAGVYDLFHIGHINIFKKAKEYCEYLLVGVVSDEAVRENKHCEPYIPFEERIEMVRSCKYVDEAVKIPLEASTVWDAYAQYHFDVQFSGSDYEHDEGWLAAQQFLRDHGSELIFFPYTESTSSTKIKKLIDKGLLE